MLCGVLIDFHFSSHTAINFFSPLVGLDCFCKNSEGGHFKSSDYIFSTCSGSHNFHNVPDAVLSCHFLPHLTLRMSIYLSDVYLCGIWRLVVSFVALGMAPFQPCYVAHIVSVQYDFKNKGIMYSSSI